MQLRQLTLALSLTAPLDALADNTPGCRAANRAYHSIARDVLGKITDYRACILRSDGRDDCSGEFLFLQGAQQSYETAMNRRLTACPPSPNQPR